MDNSDHYSHHYKKIISSEQKQLYEFNTKTQSMSEEITDLKQRLDNIEELLSSLLQKESNNSE